MKIFAFLLLAFNSGNCEAIEEEKNTCIEGEESAVLVISPNDYYFFKKLGILNPKGWY